MAVDIDPAILRSIEEGLDLLPRGMNSPQAKVMLYAIGLQESRFQHRRQIVAGKPIGPAKGFWQFERGGGCKGVVNHSASRYWMHSVCQARGVKFNATALWNALQTDDVLAASAARLLLFTDPRRLPEVGDQREAWSLYMRVWRPGHPHPQSWPAFYGQAVRTMLEEVES